MDLEKAYNKIDNLCLTNYNSATVINMDITKGRMPEKIDFFKEYNETQDDDFCKDEEEMVEALETFKKVVDLQKELGCPLDVLVKALTNGVYVIDEETKEIQYILRGLHTFTGEGLGTSVGFSDERVWRKKVNKAGIEFCPMYYWKDYKKTWWLKEDRSE